MVRDVWTAPNFNCGGRSTMVVEELNPWSDVDPAMSWLESEVLGARDEAVIGVAGPWSNGSIELNEVAAVILGCFSFNKSRVEVARRRGLGGG